MIDLEAVVALRSVATNGSVAAAADALGFTPSAVSQQIKRLERGTRVALLERAGDASVRGHGAKGDHGFEINHVRMLPNQAHK